MNISSLLRSLLQTKHEWGGQPWYGFERLTCVPIQTKMVKDSMLSGSEKQWLKVRHPGGKFEFTNSNIVS